MKPLTVICGNLPASKSLKKDNSKRLHDPLASKFEISAGASVIFSVKMGSSEVKQEKYKQALPENLSGFVILIKKEAIIAFGI